VVSNRILRFFAIDGAGNKEVAKSVNLVIDYPITVATPDNYGTINCPATAISGETAACTLTPNAGYQISSVSGCGTGTLNGTTYTTGAITEACTVTANFSLINYTVSFESNGGSSVISQSVTYNSNATTPNAPARTGYTFAGWYTDTALTSAFAFTTAVTGGTTLYAKWTTNSYAVSFNSNGGSSISNQSVAYNTVATAPTSPTRTGYTFGGWYTDTVLTSAFAFTTAVTGDTTLYAKWTTNSYTVSFNSNGGSLISNQSVAYNTIATAPTAPTRIGYIFAGWYTDTALTSAFAFTTPVTADTTLYAKWTADSVIPVKGDMNADSSVTVADALIALKIAVGLITQTPDYLQQGDVGPMRNNAPTADGKIDISDAVVILQRAVGLTSW